MTKEEYEGIILMVTGSRHYNVEDHGNRVENVLDGFCERVGVPDLLIHGGAKGADYLAQVWALKKGIQIKTYPAAWETHGKKAGPMRNTDMVLFATHCIAFPLGDSRGTWDAVRKAKKAGLEVIEVEY